MKLYNYAYYQEHATCYFLKVECCNYTAFKFTNNFICFAINLAAGGETDPKKNSKLAEVILQCQKHQIAASMIQKAISSTKVS